VNHDVLTRLAHEKLLVRYTGALDRGDAETLALVLHAAEADPVLARLIDEINAVYVAEDLADSRRIVPPNGHQRHPITPQEVTMNASSSLPANGRTSRTTAHRAQRVVPLTLAAAIAVFILTAAVIFAFQDRRRAPVTGGIQSATATPTVGTPAPAFKLDSYQGIIVYRGRVMSPGMAADSFETQTHVWFQSPAMMRQETYNTSHRYYGEAVARAVRQAALSTPVASTDPAVEMNLFSLFASDGHTSWTYAADNGAPELVMSYDDFEFRYPVTTAGDDGLLELIQRLKREFVNVQMVGAETVLSRPVYVLLMEPKPSGGRIPQIPEQVVRIEARIDQQAYLVLSVTGYDASGSIFFESHFTELHINEPIAPATFKLTLTDEAWAADQGHHTTLSAWQNVDAPYPVYAPCRPGRIDARAIQVRSTQRPDSADLLRAPRPVRPAAAHDLAGAGRNERAASKEGARTASRSNKDSAHWRP
jgi:outer membrane lipoprotein-sorting protein